tara:strand:+ start:1091 stop:1687 length:597 start_codon:yes stop_codon:yes gene_type:complete
MKNFFQLTFVLCLFSAHAQTEFDGSEIGVEIFAARAGSNGGTMGVGLKYAAILNENFAVGPSFRYHRTWNYLYNGVATDIPSSASIYGGGFFAHARYKDALFGGVEFELLKTPFNFSQTGGEFKPWIATLFIGGGFSKLYNKVRINLGVFYDVINSENSPFRPNYAIRIKNSEGGTQRILPVIYRINFFFPIGTKKEK